MNLRECIYFMLKYSNSIFRYDIVDISNRKKVQWYIEGFTKMSKKQKPTKDEHFVPQVYLKGFSPDNKLIYKCRTTDFFTPPEAVTIRSVCSEKYLYELKNDKGELVWPNYLEKILSNIEKLFGKHMKQLNSKAFIPSNYKSLYFFTKEEKYFWKSYISIQMMRMPQMIRMVEEEIVKQHGDVFPDNVLHAMALGECLPFFKNDKDFNYLIFDLRKVLESMTIALGVDESESIFTSDSPVFTQAPDYDMGKLERVEFPLSSKLVLFLFGGKLKNEYRKNSLFPLNAEEISWIQRDVACAAEEWVYLKHPITNSEIKAIQEGRALRQFVLDNTDEELEAESLFEQRTTSDTTDKLLKNLSK